MEKTESEKAMPGNQGSNKGYFSELEDGKVSKEEEMSLLGEAGRESSPFKTMALSRQTSGSTKNCYIFYFTRISGAASRPLF